MDAFGLEAAVGIGTAIDFGKATGNGATTGFGFSFFKESRASYFLVS
jgi:hypothetical protein